MNFQELVALLTKYGPQVVADIGSFEAGQPVTINAAENNVVISGVGTLKISESVTFQKVG